jgi:hypothetical protein
VFPEAWYPDSTPPNLQKWQIPSCEPCNTEYGKLEDDLLLTLACCVDPHVAETSGLYQKALRSINPELAKNDRDRSARAARGKWLRSKLVQGTDISESRIYPDLGERWGRSIEQVQGVEIPFISLSRLAEKIVRGIYFLEFKETFIEPPYQIKFYDPNIASPSGIIDILNNNGKEYARESIIVVKQVFSEDDPMYSAFEISIWGQFKMYATVSKRTSA